MSKSSTKDSLDHAERGGTGEHAELGRPRGWLSKIARDVTAIGLLVLIPGTLSRFVASAIPWELITHFQWQYWLGSLIVIALAALSRSKWIAVIALLPLTVSTLAIWSYWFGGESQQVGLQSSIMLFLSNVQTSNQSHQDVLDAIAAADPDIVILQETDATWFAAMQPLLESYPHNINAIRSDNFGMVVFSQIPFDQSSTKYIPPANVPTIMATFEIANQPVDVIATHPLPPMRFETANARNLQLKAIAEEVASRANPTIVIGDLNITPWSPHFRALIDVSGLRDARDGFGIQPTWPLRLPAVFRIPIDHCLVSDAFRVLEMKRGPDVGSDHLPIIVTLGIGEDDRSGR